MDIHLEVQRSCVVHNMFLLSSSESLGGAAEVGVCSREEDLFSESFLGFRNTS